MRYIVSSFALVSLVMLAGCGQPGDGNFFVTGTVTQGGQPLEGARVVFIPDGGAGEGASGMTDADGRFVLTTSTGNEGSGTKPGAYRVTVSKVEVQWDGVTYRMPEGPVDADTEPVRAETFLQLLPTQFGNFANTPFRATVTENRATNVFDFDIP